MAITCNQVVVLQGSNIYPVLQGPDNFFRLKYGVRPSFGLFRMLTADVQALNLNIPISIRLTDDLTSSVTLIGLYILEYKIDAQYPDICDIHIVDERYLWQHVLGTRDWNTYPRDRSTSRSVPNSEIDFALENLNGTSEWTFAQIISECASLLGRTINTSTATFPTYACPRNILGYKRPVCDILADVLYQCQHYLTIDLTGTVVSCQIYPVGGQELATELAHLSNATTRRISQQEIVVNSYLRKGAIACALVGDTAQSWYQSTQQSLGGYGAHALRTAYAAFRSADGTLNNTQYLLQRLGELTSRYADSWSREQPLRDYTYVGIMDWPLCSCIHELEWCSNEKGAITKVKTLRPLCEQGLQVSHPFIYDNLPIASGGGGTVFRLGRLTGFATYNCPTGSFLVKPQKIDATAWMSGMAYTGLVLVDIPDAPYVSVFLLSHNRSAPTQDYFPDFTNSPTYVVYWANVDDEGNTRYLATEFAGLSMWGVWPQ